MWIEKSSLHARNAITQVKIGLWFALFAGWIGCAPPPPPSFFVGKLRIQIHIWGICAVLPSTNWQLKKGNMGISCEIMLQNILLTSQGPLYRYVKWMRAEQVAKGFGILNLSNDLSYCNYDLWRNLNRRIALSRTMQSRTMLLVLSWRTLESVSKLVLRAVSRS
jgi:hypothetical protein